MQRISPEAGQAYLKGRHEFYRYTEAGLLSAIQWFEKAIMADPNFSLAYSAMAHAYCAAVSPVDAFPPGTLFGKAGDAARKALSLDASNAEARWVLGLTEMMYGWNWKAGEREIRLALAIDPNNAPARVAMAIYHLLTGQHDWAIRECEYACLLDPFSPFIRTALPQSLLLVRQFDAAKAQLLADKELLTGFFKYHCALGLCAVQNQRWRSAILEFRKAVETSGGSFFMKARLGYALAVSGRHAEARAIYQELLHAAQSRYVAATNLAVLALGQRDTNEALDWLDKAYAERATHLIFIMSDALFDPLRKLARFRDLVERIGLPNVQART